MNNVASAHFTFPWPRSVNESVVVGLAAVVAVLDVGSPAVRVGFAAVLNVVSPASCAVAASAPTVPACGRACPHFVVALMH